MNQQRNYGLKIGLLCHIKARVELYHSVHVFKNIVTYSGFLYLTAELAETAEIMMTTKRYNFSAHSAHSAVRFLYDIELMKLCA